MTMQQHWVAIVSDAVEGKGGSTRIGPTVFNKHMATLRERYTTAQIRGGFNRFAALVEAGKVDVRGKVAWFVFFGRYERLMPADAPPKNLNEIERKPVRNPLAPP